MMCQDVVVAKRHVRRSLMEQTTTIGLDIAKHVFQVHGIDAAGEVLIRRKLRRGEVLEFFSKVKPVLVGIEACAT
jgi:transposase